MHRVELDKFQGPLDLLLYFIRRDEIDIYDIPIAEITAEYLQIVEDMNAMNTVSYTHLTLPTNREV